MDSVSNNFLYGFKAARSAPRARPGSPGRRSCLRPAPARSTKPRDRAGGQLTSENGYIVAGAVGSTALGSHFGASL